MDDDLALLSVFDVRVAVPAGNGIEAGLVVLREEEEPYRTLRMIVGQPEARAIHVPWSNGVAPRPSTWDLFVSTIGLLDGRLERVVVTDVEEERHFFAQLVIRRVGEAGEEEPLLLPARPSDAIALALRAFGAGIYARPHVLDRAGLRPDGTHWVRPARTPPPAEIGLDPGDESLVGGMLGGRRRPPDDQGETAETGDQLETPDAAAEAADVAGADLAVPSAAPTKAGRAQKTAAKKTAAKKTAARKAPAVHKVAATRQAAGTRKAAGPYDETGPRTAAGAAASAASARAAAKRAALTRVGTGSPTAPGPADGTTPVPAEGTPPEATPGGTPSEATPGGTPSEATSGGTSQEATGEA